MKLFQIEEPDGTLSAPEGPGVAVGIDLHETGCAVAVAVGGNAEILPDADGGRRLMPSGALADAAALPAILLALRGRAEKQLARPVTHAVIAADAAPERAIAAAAETAGLVVLRLLSRAAAAGHARGAPAGDAAALGAAIEAENLAPMPASEG